VETQAYKMLRIKQLAEKIGLSRSTIYERINPKSKKHDPAFPRPVALWEGPKAPVAWIESEVDAWLVARIEAVRGGCHE
jgi:prophage regulatory protein